MKKRLDPSMDMDVAKTTPAAFFSDPAEVVGQPLLSDEQRLAILHQWELDALNLSVAEGEGMEGGEESPLGKIRQMIDIVSAH